MEEENMLEALVLSLGLMNNAYFQMEDLRDRFLDLLNRVPEEQVVVLLGAPAEWDMAAAPKMPAYIAYKWTKGKGVQAFPPADYGFLVLSSIQSGEIHLLPLNDNSHKMPMPSRGKKTPPPPGANLDKLTISYDGVWRQIDIQDLPWADNQVAIAALCGPALSNVHVVNVRNRSDKPGPASVTPACVGPEYHYARTNLSPAIPHAFGIALSCTSPLKAVAGSPCPIYGSFLLPTSQQGDITIHLLFSQPGAPGMQKYVVTIPRDACVIEGDMVKGYFLFDLMSTMYWKSAGRFDLPKALFVSAVHRKVFSKPYLCTLQPD